MLCTSAERFKESGRQPAASMTKDMINVLLEGNVKRSSGEYFDVGYLLLEYDTILANGEEENAQDEKRYYSSEEKSLIKKLWEYKTIT